MRPIMFTISGAAGGHCDMLKRLLVTFYIHLINALSLSFMACFSILFLFFGTPVMAVPVTITDVTDPLATSTATYDPYERQGVKRKKRSGNGRKTKLEGKIMRLKQV